MSKNIQIVFDGATVRLPAPANTNENDGIDRCSPERGPASAVSTDGAMGRQPAEQTGSIVNSVRTLLILASEGAFDLMAGHRKSPYLDRFEILYKEQSRKLAALPEDGGQADFRFLIRRARRAYEAFGDTVRRDVIEGVSPEIGKKSFDEALERVKQSAVTAGAFGRTVEMAMAKV